MNFLGASIFLLNLFNPLKQFFEITTGSLLKRMSGKVSPVAIVLVRPSEGAYQRTQTLLARP
jgi:hypothetical protein